MLMKKRSIILIILGAILLIIPFCLSNYSILRLIILALGIFLITLSLVFVKKRNIFLIIITPLILICLSYAVDTFMFYQFKRIPLFVYEIKSSDSMSTYNSFFYRIFDCNGSLTLDYGYLSDYVCAEGDLDEVDINTFLSEPIKTYDEYKNKFVKLSGKISKISGEESIELSSFTTTDGSLNGYVNFNTNYVVRVNVNESLSNYRIYDNITVIGRVANLTEEGNVTVINLLDTMLIPSNIYDNYSYEIVNSNNEELVSLASAQNYYLYGISSLTVKYTNNDIYELSYLITDSRFTLDTIIGDTSATNMYDDEETLQAKFYELEKFNVMVCENDKKIIANKSFDLTIDLCD